MKTNPLDKIRGGQELSVREQFGLVVRLSLPGILAQLTTIAMQYIDAAMLGRLGAEECAAVGLVSTSSWLIGGLCMSASAGFTVQAAHLIGANDMPGARSLLRAAYPAVLGFIGFVAIVGALLSPFLPVWLGGDVGAAAAGKSVAGMAGDYFLIYCLALPFAALNALSGGMLRAAGSMKIPSALNALMCLLDVVFNYLLIYVAGLGVVGAALGTALAECVISLAMTVALWRGSGFPIKARAANGCVPPPPRKVYRKALKIAAPMALQHIAICSAQVISTIIVAPLGVVAIAANSFAITAESVCYMPGYGISEAAITLVGQSKGAGRHQLVRHFAWLTVGLGVAVMSLMGVLMYFVADMMMAFMTNIPDICSLGAEVLRIECFAEPMFAASIVAYGVMVGMGRTVAPCVINFSSMYGVRLTLAWWLAPILGLRGVWIAMCAELCFRGFLFLTRLWYRLDKDKRTANVRESVV